VNRVRKVRALEVEVRLVGSFASTLVIVPAERDIFDIYRAARRVFRDAVKSASRTSYRDRLV
jgi:hypothetical protein